MIPALAAIRAAIGMFAPAESSLVDQAVVRILAGEGPNAVGLDMELTGDQTRQAADRAAAARTRPSTRRRRRVVVQRWT